MRFKIGDRVRIVNAAHDAQGKRINGRTATIVGALERHPTMAGVYVHLLDVDGLGTHDIFGDWCAPPDHLEPLTNPGQFSIADVLRLPGADFEIRARELAA